MNPSRARLAGLLACACALIAPCACAPVVTAPPIAPPAATSRLTSAAVVASPTPAPAKPAPRKAPALKRKAPSKSMAGSTTVPDDNALLEWNFHRNTRHKVPDIPDEARRLVKRYSAMYVGPDKKLVYLTFDEGYENGNTKKILDTLKRNGVPATFFVTGDYCREAPKLCRRMLAEGHVVGSHSDKHPAMPSVTSNPTRFEQQFTRADTAFRKATGEHLTHLFRPPMGDYSAKSLAMTQNLGYTSVFWSFAHVDYDEKRQPPVDTTIERVLSGSHPGAIFLLHGISSSDASALDEIIAGLRKQGYGFGTLEPKR